MTLERYRSIVDDWAAFQSAAGKPEPTVFRVGTGRIDEGALLLRLADQGFRTRPVPGMPTFHQVVEEPHPVSMTFEHWNGLLYVQQASTGVAAPALGPLPGERVLDLCAAPGGKTAHIAQLMDDRGCLVASEISESRIRGLLGNLYRLGHTHVLAIAGDGRELPDGALFDRVLVDAPCSGEGTLRRRGGRPPRQSNSFAGFVTRAQRSLLRRAIALTRPGGTVLYVTCTFAPEENEAVVSEILGTEPVDLDPLHLPVAHAPGLTAFEGERYDPRLAGAARIYPHHLNSGGLFLARLRKHGGSAAGKAAAAGEPRKVDGWTSVPVAFAEGGGASDGAAADMDAAAAADLVAQGLEELSSRYGVPRDALDGFSWTVRGGRVWMHGAASWPVGAWAPGGWRTISIGLRALEFDTRGRVRPTNDLLRRLSGHVRKRVLTLDEPALRRLLQGQAVDTGVEERGPIALAWRGEVVGRGAVTGEGLKSEIPKARAADLLRVLDAGAAARGAGGA